MAGVQAGRLSIEIVAEIARLQQDLDRAKRAVGSASNDIARAARAANDNITQGTMGVGQSFDRLGRQAESLRAKLSPLAAAQQQFARSMQEADRLYRSGAISVREYEAATELARRGFRQQVVAINDSNKAMSGAYAMSGRTRMGMQQLSFQVNDVATMFAMGARPMQIFASQGGQVMQAVQLMSGGTSKLAAFLGGPWGIAVMSAVTVVIAFAGSLFRAEESADKAASAITDLAQQFDFARMSAEQLKDVNKLLAESNAEVERTSIAAANATRIKAEEDRDAAKAALQRARAEYERILAFTSDPTFAEGSVAYGGYLAKAGATPQKMAELEKAIAGFDEQANRNRFNVELWTAELDESGRATERLRTRINELRQAYEESGDPKLLQRAIQLQDQIGQIEEAARRSGRSRRAALSEEQKALRDRNRETERFIQSLNEEIEKIGLDGKALRALQIQKAIEAAVTQKQVDAIQDANRRREEAIAAQEREAAVLERVNRLRSAQAATRELDKSVETLRVEAEVLGMSGWVRERRLAQLQREAEIGPRLIAQALALASGDKALADEMQRQIDLLNEKYGLQIQMGDDADRHRQAVESLRLYNDELRDTMYMLQRMGGMGDALAGLLGLVSGNIGGIRGSLGMLLNTQTGQRRDEKTGEIIAVRLGDELRQIFGMDGPFGQMLTMALHNAGIGMAAGQMAGARGTAGQVGSAAGGILGGIAGNALQGAIGKAAGSVFGKALGSAIGSAVPVVGTILGGIAGGLLGGVFGGTKKGGATFGGSGANLGVRSTWGNSDERIAAASDLAGGVVDALARIADQLGVEMGGFTGSIGVRKGSLRYDPTGRGILKPKKGAQDFGQDQAALVAAVIRDAINDGVFRGLSAGVERLLKRGGDIDAQLQKALAFQGVFDELERLKDPAGSAVAALEAEFAQLKAIFDEAGASAAEYAKLEELRALKLAELEKQGGKTGEELSRRRELEIELMQAQGEYMGALALARQQELDELPEALHALQQQVWAAQLLNDRRLLEIQLMEAQGNAAGALAAQREMELAATHESLRGLKEQIWAWEDAQEAARAAEQLRTAWASVSDGIMDEVRRLRGLTGSADGQSFATLMAQFNAVTATARGGDIEAAKRLPALSQDLLRAAELAATSRQELDRVRAQAAASLEATNAAIAAMSGSDAALLAAAAGHDAAASANDNLTAAVTDANRAVREELAQLRSEMNAGLAAVAGNTGRVAKKLDDVTAASGGDAISTVAAA